MSEHQQEPEPREPVLRPPRNAVDRRAIGYWTVEALLLVTPVVAILVVLAILIPPARVWLLLAAAVWGVPGLIYVVVMPTWRYRVHRWETTDDAIYAASGWIWQEARIAPLSRVQTVDTARNPLHRLFGISSLTVTTASAAGPVRIDGLEASTASSLAETLGAAVGPATVGGLSEDAT